MREKRWTERKRPMKHTHTMYIKLTYLRQSPSAVPVFCLGTSKQVSGIRSIADERGEHHRPVITWECEKGGPMLSLHGSRKLLKMYSRIIPRQESAEPPFLPSLPFRVRPLRPSFTFNKRVPSVARRSRIDVIRLWYVRSTFLYKSGLYIRYAWKSYYIDD